MKDSDIEMDQSYQEKNLMDMIKMMVRRDNQYLEAWQIVCQLPSNLCQI